MIHKMLAMKLPLKHLRIDLERQNSWVFITKMLMSFPSQNAIKHNT